MEKRFYRQFIWIFLLALFLRLTSWGILRYQGKTVFESDSYGYHRLAVNLLEHHRFSRSKGTSLEPDGFRTPLYPLYLTFIYRVFGINPEVAVLFQILIGSLSPVLLLKMGEILEMKKAGLVSALLLALDFPSLFFSNVLLTETLFTFLFLLSAFFLICFFQSFRKKHIIIAGSTLGLSSLCRPLSLYSLIFILPFFFFLPLSRKERVKSISAFILSFSLILSPWLIRNYNTFGVFQISTVRDYNLLFWNVRLLQSERENISLEETEQKLEAEVNKEVNPEVSANPFLKARIYRQIALREIKKSPFLYLRLHLIKGPINLLDNFGISVLFHYFGEKLSPRAREMMVKKQFGRVFPRYPLLVILTFILEAYLLIAYIFALGGIYFCFRERKFILSFILALIAYFILATGPIAYVRFRVPIMPYIYLISGSGISYLIESIRRRRLKVNRI